MAGSLRKTYPPTPGAEAVGWREAFHVFKVTRSWALLIGLINNGLILAGLDSSQQQVVRGVIIILAVALARKK